MHKPFALSAPDRRYGQHSADIFPAFLPREFLGRQILQRDAINEVAKFPSGGDVADG
jgi:hypothetical protein